MNKNLKHKDEYIIRINCLKEWVRSKEIDC